MVQEAADAVELILSDGIDAAMNRVNTATGPEPRHHLRTRGNGFHHRG